MTDKLKVTTTSLAGCFGCHMSLLDIDEKLIELVELVEFTRTPLTDIKEISHADLAIIEGGVSNEENLEILLALRKKSKKVAAIGACALSGGIPAMRNQFAVEECLNEAYINGPGVENPQIPDDKEIPRMREKVQPLHELIKVDYFLPGCPPPAEVIWSFLTAFTYNKPIKFGWEQIKYD